VGRCLLRAGGSLVSMDVATTQPLDLETSRSAYIANIVNNCI